MWLEGKGYKVDLWDYGPPCHLQVPPHTLSFMSSRWIPFCRASGLHCDLLSSVYCHCRGDISSDYVKTKLFQAQS